MALATTRRLTPTSAAMAIQSLAGIDLCKKLMPMLCRPDSTKINKNDLVWQSQRCFGYLDYA